jgi:opacity protein-like surface antigen
MLHRRSRKSLQLAVLFSFSALIALSNVPAARAQATPGASRSAEISAFIGYTNSNSDYGRFRSNGGTIGVDYTRYFGWRVVPSFEMRANRTNGVDLTTQESILFGPRLHIDVLRRYHPYVDVLYGATKINFAVPLNPHYTSDQANTLSIGGGVDIDIIPHFQAKVDYQGEYMNFGPNGTQPNNADFTLAPTLFTVGINYRIPLHAHKSQSDR